MNATNPLIAPIRIRMQRTAAPPLKAETISVRSRDRFDDASGVDLLQLDLGLPGRFRLFLVLDDSYVFALYHRQVAVDRFLRRLLFRSHLFGRLFFDSLRRHRLLFGSLLNGGLFLSSFLLSVVFVVVTHLYTP